MFDLTKPTIGIAGVAPYSVIYGQNGIGKTTFAAMPPNTVFADVERGIPERLRNIPRFQINSLAEQIGMFEALRTQQHNYSHVVIDSLSALNNKLTEEICREQKWTLPDGRPDVGEKGYTGYGRGEKIAGEKFAALANAAIKLKEDRNIAITMLAHVRIIKIRPPDIEEYARYDLALPATAIEVLTQRADIVGFMSYPITTMRDDKNRNAIAKAIGEADARLYLRNAATHNAKNRYELPESITIPAGNPIAGFSQFAANIPYYAPLFQQAPTPSVQATPAAA